MAEDESVLWTTGIRVFPIDGISVPYQCTNVACTFNIFPPSSEEDGQVSSVDALDLPSVAVTCREMGADYNIRRFAPCFFRLSRTEALRKFLIERSIYEEIYNDEEAIKLLNQNVVVFLFSYGKAVVIGAKDYDSSVAMANRFSRSLGHYLCIPTGVYNFELNNMVFSFELPFSLNLASLLEFPELSQRISYNPSNFPMACIRPDKIKQQQEEKERQQRGDWTASNDGKNVTIMMSVGGSVIVTGSRNEQQALDTLREAMPFFRRVEANKGQIASSDMPMQVVCNQQTRLLESYEDNMWSMASQLVVGGTTEMHQRKILRAASAVGDTDQDHDMIAVMSAMREGILRMKARGELGMSDEQKRAAGQKRKRATAAAAAAKKKKKRMGK